MSFPRSSRDYVSRPRASRFRATGDSLHFHQRSVRECYRRDNLVDELQKELDYLLAQDKVIASLMQARLNPDQIIPASGASQQMPAHLSKTKALDLAGDDLPIGRQPSSASSCGASPNPILSKPMSALDLHYRGMTLREIRDETNEDLDRMREYRAYEASGPASLMQYICNIKRELFSRHFEQYRQEGWRPAASLADVAPRACHPEPHKIEFMNARARSPMLDSYRRSVSCRSSRSKSPPRRPRPDRTPETFIHPRSPSRYNSATPDMTASLSHGCPGSTASSSTGNSRQTTPLHDTVSRLMSLNLELFKPSDYKEQSGDGAAKITNSSVVPQTLKTRDPRVRNMPTAATSGYFTADKVIPGLLSEPTPDGSTLLIRSQCTVKPRSPSRDPRRRPL